MKNREHVLIFLRNKKEDKIDSKTRNETTETLELHKISAPKQNQYSKLHHTINWWLIFVFQFVCESYIQNCACISTQLQYGINGQACYPMSNLNNKKVTEIDKKIGWRNTD